MAAIRVGTWLFHVYATARGNWSEESDPRNILRRTIASLCLIPHRLHSRPPRYLLGLLWNHQQDIESGNDGITLALDLLHEIVWTCRQQRHIRKAESANSLAGALKVDGTHAFKYILSAFEVLKFHAHVPHSRAISVEYLKECQRWQNKWNLRNGYRSLVDADDDELAVNLLSHLIANNCVFLFDRHGSLSGMPPFETGVPLHFLLDFGSTPELL